MKVLLAGASGALGQRVHRKMKAAGHDVATLGRGAGSSVRADLLDGQAVLRAVEGWPSTRSCTPPPHSAGWP